MSPKAPSQVAHEAVTVSLADLKESAVPFERLEEAFGPSSLGILIVKDIEPRFVELRHRLLSYSSYLANLPPEELETLAVPSSNYLTGWSHGKESLKSGAYDTLKGSYYINCAFYQDPTLQGAPASEFPNFSEYTAANVWPSESSLPGFRETFEDLCTLIIDTAVLVARACDSYAVANVEGYKDGYLEHVVKTSMTTKARLLHYFPPQTSNLVKTPPKVEVAKEEADDSWCATHIDHGCLTGLTSALYVDESQHPPHPSPPSSNSPNHLSPLPYLSHPPSPTTGLYIHSRTHTITKITIPPSCLAFQTGEALQLITGGKFRAVPHFVRVGGGADGGLNGGRVARNTLAVFTQPNLGEVVDVREGRGVTFAEFSKEVVGRFG